jgi:hypothetical protein
MLTLVAGDLLVFLIFATIGRQNHGETSGILEVILTAAPFAAGWFLVAPFLGAYRSGIEVNPKLMLRYTLLSWILGWAVGMTLRCLIKWAIPNWTFFFVSYISVAILLLVWRLPFAYSWRARARQITHPRKS